MIVGQRINPSKEVGFAWSLYSGWKTIGLVGKWKSMKYEPPKSVAFCPPLRFWEFWSPKIVWDVKAQQSFVDWAHSVATEGRRGQRTSKVWKAKETCLFVVPFCFSYFFKDQFDWMNPLWQFLTSSKHFFDFELEVTCVCNVLDCSFSSQIQKTYISLHLFPPFLSPKPTFAPGILNLPRSAGISAWRAISISMSDRRSRIHLSSKLLAMLMFVSGKLKSTTKIYKVGLKSPKQTRILKYLQWNGFFLLITNFKKCIGKGRFCRRAFLNHRLLPQDHGMRFWCQNVCGSICRVAGDVPKALEEVPTCNMVVFPNGFI